MKFKKTDIRRFNTHSVPCMFSNCTRVFLRIVKNCRKQQFLQQKLKVLVTANQKTWEDKLHPLVERKQHDSFFQKRDEQMFPVHRFGLLIFFMKDQVSKDIIQIVSIAASQTVNMKLALLFYLEISFKVFPHLSLNILSDAQTLRTLLSCSYCLQI